MDPPRALQTQTHTPGTDHTEKKTYVEEYDVVTRETGTDREAYSHQVSKIHDPQDNITTVYLKEGGEIKMQSIAKNIPPVTTHKCRKQKQKNCEQRRQGKQMLNAMRISTRCGDTLSELRKITIDLTKNL